MLTLGHNEFYGLAQFRRELGSFSLSHSIADRPAQAVERHAHVDAHFVLVTDGEYRSSARGSATAARPLVYNPPGTTHRDHFRNGIGSFFTVSIAPDRLEELEALRRLKYASFVDNAVSRSTAHRLLLACLYREPDVSIEALCYELLETTVEAASQLGRQPFAPPWLRRAFDLVEDEYSRNLSVRQVASEVGVHPVHLARVFRRHLGCSPGDLLKLRRLEKAAGLIGGSEMSLAQVAVVCGFNDQSHMTNTFRELYGTSPGKYRRAVLSSLFRAASPPCRYRARAPQQSPWS